MHTRFVGSAPPKLFKMYKDVVAPTRRNFSPPPSHFPAKRIDSSPAPLSTIPTLAGHRLRDRTLPTAPKHTVMQPIASSAGHRRAFRGLASKKRGFHDFIVLEMEKQEAETRWVKTNSPHIHGPLIICLFPI